MNEIEIYLNAPLDGSPEDLERYLKKACGDNEELREKAELMLDSRFRRSTDFMENPAFSLARLPHTDRQPRSVTGSVVGNCKLLEEIGEGGFGVVYKAEQLSPGKRLVALKIVKPGPDTRQIVARFESERQTLAMMDHPNIARIFEAGATDDGRPYFVMELVSGPSISRYCAEKKLTIAERLEIFVDVCKGVQHAHQKGIIHRDLKPSNVLVIGMDGKAIPKVIDFGIAKATRSEELSGETLTHLGQLVGTPAYMSPEQATGDRDIDTRSDIYSLGVLLYELLTEKLPFAKSTDISEVYRQIKEATPLRPSTRISEINEPELNDLAEHFKTEPKRLRTTVRGDLDWIVMKSLEKDRSRRYDSAQGLLEDIERYLNHEPVLASPPGLLYEATKFFQRHRNSVISGAAIILLLLSLMGMGLYSRHKNSLADADRLSSLKKELQSIPLSPYAGRRDKGLAAVSIAAKSDVSLETRDSAIKCLSLHDILPEPEMEWDEAIEDRSISFDRSLLNYAIDGADGRITIRKSGTGEILSELPLLFHHVERLLFSQDGDLLAIWSTTPLHQQRPSGILSIWSIERKEWLLQDQKVGGKSSVMDFSPNGKWIAYGIGPRKLEIRHLEEPARIIRHEFFLEDGLRSLHRILFQPTGKYLAIQTLDGQNFSFLDWRTGRRSSVFFPDVLNDFAWHPSGRLICISPKNSPLFLCAAESDGTFRDPKSLGLGTIGMNKLSFSGDGSFLITSDGENMLRLWDPAADREIVRLPLPGGDSLGELQTTADSPYLGWSHERNTIKLLSFAQSKSIHVLATTTSLESRRTEGAFDSSGEILFLTSNQGVRLFDWRRTQYLGFLALNDIRSVAWDSRNDENYLIVAGDIAGGMRIRMNWNDQTLRPGALRFYDTPPCDSDTLMSISPTFVSISDGNAIHTYHPTEFERAVPEWRTEGRSIVAMTMSQLSEMIAIVDRSEEEGSQHLKILRLKNEKWSVDEDLPLPGGRSVTISPDERWLIAGAKDGYHIHKTSNWRLPPKVFPVSDQIASAPIAIDSEGKYAAWVSDENHIALVQLSNFEIVAHLPPSDDSPVTDLVFSPSGGELAIVRRDQRAEVWDFSTLNDELREFGLHWTEGMENTTEDPPPVRWSGFGNIFTKTSRKKFEEWETALVEIAPVDAGTALQKGDGFRSLREFSKAEATYLAGLDIDPNHLNLHSGLALNFIAQNRPLEAIKSWEDALRIDSTYAPSQVRLAQLLLLGSPQIRKEENGHSLALELERKLDEASGPFLYHIHFSIAASRFRKANYSSALASINEAELHGPGANIPMCDLLYLKSMCYAKLDDYENAEIAYSAASGRWHLDPTFYQEDAQVRSIRNEASGLLAHDIHESAQ